jgi:hypothetical protein
MKHRLFVPTLLLAAALAASPAAAQGPDFEKAQIRPEKVAEGVWVLISVGGNIGVSTGPDGVFAEQFLGIAVQAIAADAKAGR